MRALAFAFTFAFTFTSLARAETRAGYGGAAQGALASAPISLDPLSPSLGDQEVAALVFDTPFRIDATGQPRASLAISLDPPSPAAPQAEGLLPQARARLKIRTDVRFHDGTPVRAADVAASLQRAVREPGGWSLGPVRAARVVADDTVELELSRPAPDLALLLSTPAAAITPGGAAPTATRTIGSGPFAVESAALGGESPSVKLTANAACFAGRPYLDALLLRAFGSRTDEGQCYEVGTLHAARHAASAFQVGGTRRASVDVESAPALVGFLAIGRALPDDVAGPLRAALATGIDRERLRRLIREPARVSVAPVPYDPAAAKTALERRFPNRLKLTLLVDRSRFDDRALADRLLAELSRLGIDLTIESTGAASYQRRLAEQKYELALGVAAPPAPNAGLAELELLAAVDPAAARATLAHAPATGVPESSLARVISLYQRGARVHHAPELRGLALDWAGRISWPDVHFRRR